MTTRCLTEVHQRAKVQALLNNKKKVMEMKRTSASVEMENTKKAQELEKCGLTFSVEHRGTCIMCRVVANNISVHRKSSFHLAVKELIYPKCDVCGERFGSKKLLW